MIEVKRKEGESVNAFLFRFNKKMQHSGILKESKRRRFSTRTMNKRAVKDSAMYRANKKTEIEHQRKMGIVK